MTNNDMIRENKPDLDGYTVDEAFQSGWNHAIEAFGLTMEEECPFDCDYCHG